MKTFINSDTHIFEFDPHENITIHPEFQAPLTAYVAFIRSNISDCPNFQCHIYREKGITCMTVYLETEIGTKINLKASGYSHIKSLKDIKSLKSTCHFIDSTDMFHMAGYLLHALNATQSNSIEDAEIALYLAELPENGGYKRQGKSDSNAAKWSS